MRTRPYSKVPHSNSTPQSIFVTAIDTRPLAADPCVVVDQHRDDFSRGLDVLSKLTNGSVHLCTGVDWNGPTGTDPQIRHTEFAGPHPAGLAGYSLVTVEFRPQSAASESSSIWNTITGQQPESTPEHTAFGEVWQMDIPDWHLASLVSQLKEKQFFRRVKGLGHESEIETVLDGKRFAKEFSAVPDLDAMIVNIRRNGRRIDSAGMSNSPLNLPPFAMRPMETYGQHEVTRQAGPYVLQRLPEVVRNSRDSDGRSQ